MRFIGCERARRRGLKDSCRSINRLSRRNVVQQMSGVNRHRGTLARSAQRY